MPRVNDGRSWQRAWDNWCSWVSTLLFSPPHWYSPWRQINSTMGICILLKVNDFGSQQRSCGDWRICTYLLQFPQMHHGTPTVTEIKDGAFLEYMQKSLVILQNGLEMIGSNAFEGTSIKSIKIPPSVKEISDDAFEHCSYLTRVMFCDMIKKIVSRTLMKYWLNQGVRKKCLSTYCSQE